MATYPAVIDDLVVLIDISGAKVDDDISQKGKVHEQVEGEQLV